MQAVCEKYMQSLNKSSPTGFGMFVRPHHKPQFLQTCADLTGRPTIGKDLELQGPRDESATVPSELTHEDMKPGEGPLEDSLYTLALLP